MKKEGKFLVGTSAIDITHSVGTFLTGEIKSREPIGIEDPKKINQK